MAKPGGLTVAITGPTGTFGQALVPLLENDDRVRSMVGIARRDFDPSATGWSKMTYGRGDVRDREALTGAFAGADVVVHLAFLVTGTASPHTTREINLGGTLNAVRAATDAGVRRFVYASSAAAYGFHDDNPVGMSEEWPTRPADHLFYAREKAELDVMLRTDAASPGGPDLYILRPPIVVGPHAVGAKDLLPPPLRAALRRSLDLVDRLPVPLPVFVPAVELQLIHENDVAEAFRACIVGDGPPGVYNIAGDGVLTFHDVARELGLLPLPWPLGTTRRAARAVAGVPTPPFVPDVIQWAEALSHPVVIDTTRARQDLGWTPQRSGLEALRDALASPEED